MKQFSDLTDQQIIDQLKLIESLRTINVKKLLNDQLENDIPEDITITARGEMFDISKQGIVPTLVENLYKKRSEVKKKQLAAMQQIEDGKQLDTTEQEKLSVQYYNQQLALKILMNSLYGAMSNKFFRYFDVRIAESITLSAQLTIRWAEKTINQLLNERLQTNNVDYIIAIDTDSLYINFGPLVQTLDKNMTRDQIQKYLDQLCEDVVTPTLEKAFDQLKTKMNSPKQKMVMKREVIADKGIWTGKKHYILNVLNSEGVQYSEPKLKLVGIEAVKSSTPYVCRQMIKDGLFVIMNKQEKDVQEYIEQCYERFKEHRAEDIAFPRGVSDLDKYISMQTIYKKATPIHVRAAIVYNYNIDKFGLDSKYQKISSAEKVKFIYLKLPNPIKENVIAFNTVLPPEFEINNFIDYKTQFEKAFLSPIRSILEVIGWSDKPNNINTLDQFFE